MIPRKVEYWNYSCVSLFFTRCDGVLYLLCIFTLYLPLLGISPWNSAGHVLGAQEMSRLPEVAPAVLTAGSGARASSPLLAGRVVAVCGTYNLI